MYRFYFEIFNIFYKTYFLHSLARIQEVLSEGAHNFQLDNVFYYYYFLLDEGRKDQNTTTCISGPSSADDGPTLNDGFVAL